MHEDDRERVSRQGTEAWRRVKKEKNWHDWLKVGEALQVGRDWAMRQAQTNKPEGKGYNVAFSEWLAKYKLDDMDKGTRARLFEVIQNLPAIEEWRFTLTLTERLKLNHPDSVLRKWRAHHIEREDKTKAKKRGLRDSVADLEEAGAAKDKEIADLKAHIADLEAARETATPSSSEGKGSLDSTLTELLAFGRFELKDLARGDTYNPIDLIEAATNLKDVAAELKRRASKRTPS